MEHMEQIGGMLSLSFSDFIVLGKITFFVFHPIFSSENEEVRLKMALRMALYFSAFFFMHYSSTAA